MTHWLGYIMERIATYRTPLQRIGTIIFQIKAQRAPYKNVRMNK